VLFFARDMSQSAWKEKDSNTAFYPPLLLSMAFLLKSGETAALPRADRLAIARLHLLLSLAPQAGSMRR